VHLLAGTALVFCVACFAQEKTLSEFLSAVGDAPDVAPPLATDLSPALNRAAVEKAVLKVADWQLDRVRHDFQRDWTFAALYSGLMAASESTGNPKYRDAMLSMSQFWRSSKIIKKEVQQNEYTKNSSRENGFPKNKCAYGPAYFRLAEQQHHGPSRVRSNHSDCRRVFREV
jgi:hypothetical protein